MEVWKEIPGYEGRFSVSNLGRVRSESRFVYNDVGKYYKNGVVMKQQIGRSGYYCISLRDCNRKNSTYYVHRLVAAAFCPKDDDRNYVNHKDGNKLNNIYTNLEWVTFSQNCIHAIQNGLSVPVHKRYKPPTGHAFHTSCQVLRFKDDILVDIYESILDMELATHQCRKSIFKEPGKNTFKGYEYLKIKLRHHNIKWDTMQEYIGRPESDLPKVLFG